jgi:hypothetical protein
MALEPVRSRGSERAFALPAKKPKPTTAARTIRHGGRDLRIPVLSAPVGPDTPALKAKYPGMNQPADLAIVDYYLSAIEAIKAIGPEKSQNSMGISRLFGIVEKNVRWEDRNAAIKDLHMHLDEIADREEKDLGIIKPDLPAAKVVGTWRALVDLGDTAEKLLGDAKNPGHTKYIHTGPFDHSAFARGYREEFNKVPPGGIFKLLHMMETDGHVIDIRWMAYMLATCYTETKMTFRPIDEDRQGDLGWRKVKDPDTKKVVKDPVTGKVLKVHRGYRDYYLPARVKKLPDGRARLTEQDGDQYIINGNGHGFNPVGADLAARMAAKEKVLGAPVTGAAAKDVYLKDDGVERKYFGRGYVQVTWWTAYAEAGWALGRGLDFLLNPELVKEPRTSYKIMSLGMRTGTIFANGQTFGKFICGGHCDYYNARQMVNSHSGAHQIADHALKFERILLASKYTLLA